MTFVKYVKEQPLYESRRAGVPDGRISSDGHLLVRLCSALRLREVSLDEQDEGAGLQATIHFLRHTPTQNRHGHSKLQLQSAD